MMKGNSGEKFRDLHLLGKILVISALALLIIIALSILFGVFLFGFNGLFVLFDVQYQSLWSLAIYVGSFLLFGSIADLFSRVVIAITTVRMMERYKIFLT